MLLSTNFCVLMKFLYGLYSSLLLSFHNNSVVVSGTILVHLDVPPPPPPPLK